MLELLLIKKLPNILIFIIKQKLKQIHIIILGLGKYIQRNQCWRQTVDNLAPLMKNDMQQLNINIL